MIYGLMKVTDGRQALEDEKKDFVRASKRFSNALKEYFRDNNCDKVYVAANDLLLRLDHLLRVVKLHTEQTKLDESLYCIVFIHKYQCDFSFDLNAFEYVD
jgi:uncharacterized Fe-S cluster-containing radical SAM superfamily protein